MFIMTQAWFILLAGIIIPHWMMPASWRGMWIVIASAIFLAIKSPISLAILILCTIIIHFITRNKDRISGKELITLIVSVGGILFFYKTKAALSVTTGLNLSPDVDNFIIPLGLSYYAFRCIHYGVEKYKGTIPAHPLTELVQYLFFLPTFVAGPIHRFHDFQKDLERKRWDPYMFAQGLERILFGYFKVTFLANLLVTNLMMIYIGKMGIEGSSIEVYLTTISYTLNLYFLFSGYSDIAIGFGMLLGIKVMENFNFPFLAKNISDFWTRWHISLTSWCKDYVYMGTIATTRSAGLSAIAAMLTMGLWHEFSLRFLVWGIYHGIGIMIWQKFQGVKLHLPSINNAVALKVLGILSTLLTLHYFMIGVLIARTPTLSTSFELIHKLIFFWL